MEHPSGVREVSDLCDGDIALLIAAGIAAHNVICPNREDYILAMKVVREYDAEVLGEAFAKQRDYIYAQTGKNQADTWDDMEVSKALGVAKLIDPNRRRGTS